MKRPPGLWVLLSAGVLWLSMQDVYGIRATSLIFGKSTTTTTSTTTTEAAVASEDEVATTEVPVDGNSTKPALTGNPQIDYIWDPNLPKELNGYNLSDYPFYERVPEDIDFKCDGLHDGFYASVKHKCQVYHHCLFGTRYDFLCANYTAFDQKTFICHFASEVDCANSKRFWHRNDALYIAATTTTIKPFVIHTTPKPVPITPIALMETGNTYHLGPRRNVGAHRRPLRRRRPQVFYRDDDIYYEDYYEDYRTRFRIRPTTWSTDPPWPTDEYEEYEAFVRDRVVGGRRRPYNRGSSSRRRNKNKSQFEYDDEDDRFDDEDYRSSSRRKANNRKKIVDDTDYPTTRKHGKRRPQGGRESYEKRKRRPVNDYVDEDYDDYERPKKKHGKTKTEDETRTMIKPVSGTIYDRPRVAPKIKPPVPKNEAEKYAYKPITTTSMPKKYDDYYDYDEEPKRGRPTYKNAGGHKLNEERNKTSKQTQHRGSIEPRNPAQVSTTESYTTVANTKESGSSTEDQYLEEEPFNKNEDYYDDYQDDDEETGMKIVSSKTTTTTTTTSTTTPVPTVTTTTTQAPIVRIEQPLIRLVKRPFLPSRGGNPFTSRGLQPVGSRALGKDETRQEDNGSKNEEVIEEQVSQPIVFNNSPVVMKKPDPVFTSDGGAQEEFRPQLDPRIAYQNKDLPNVRATTPQKPPETNIFPTDVQEEFQPRRDPRPTYKNKEIPYSRPNMFTSEGGVQEPFRPQPDPRVTYKSKAIPPAKTPEKNPLDINANDYDVTLNDALNPTLPNLPVRGYSIANEYSHSNFRPQYNADQAVAPAMAEYAYQIDPPSQRYDVIPRGANMGQVTSTNNDYKGQYSMIRENYRPRQTQQTQAFYSRY